MIPKRIFLDLDDVLNDFTMHVLEKLGCQDLHYNPEWGWDIVWAANMLHPVRSFTQESFWNSVTREMWSSAPKSREFLSILDGAVNLVGRENVCILSSPTLDPECLAGKLEWIHSNMPEWMHRQYLIGPPKSMCAVPDALLIDDRDKNVDEFIAAGGQAILMPRPWNSLHDKDTRVHMDWAFETLQHQKDEATKRGEHYEANLSNPSGPDVYPSHQMDGVCSSILVCEESSPPASYWGGLSYGDQHASSR